MRTTQISIIECPANLGLKAPAPGVQPGVWKLPDWLRLHGLHTKIEPHRILKLPAPPYAMTLDSASGVRNADALVGYARQLAPVVSGELDQGNFALVLGGDCSVLLGPLLSLKRAGNFALFYLDGHTDYMWPELSHTGGAGGMVAAFAAGKGPDKLANIDGLKPYIPAKHVWCVGNREYVDWYENAIIQSDATYVPLHRLRSDGAEAVVSTFLGTVEGLALDGFWVHFDVDVLNDELMPAVDSRTPDGLDYAELASILRPLLSHPKIAGLTLTILDPDLDPEGHFIERFVDEVAPILGYARSSTV